MDTIAQNGENGILAQWNNYYRHPEEVHYKEALVSARKRKAGQLDDEEALDVSPGRKKRRDDNFRAKQQQARGFKANAAKAAGGEIEIGAVVQYNSAEVDTTKVDPKTSTFVVVDRRSAKGAGAATYKLANQAGVLKDWIHQVYGRHLPQVRRC